MRNMRTVIWAAVMTLLAGEWHSGLALGRQAGSEAETITLSHRLSRTVARITTPSRVLPNRNRWRCMPGETISIIGRDMEFQVDEDKLGLDLDGDGTIGEKEWSDLDENDGAAFKIPLDPEDGRTDYVGVVLKDITGMGVETTAGDFTLLTISGRMEPISCMEGRLDGKYVRLFDDNLDGQFTQDGSDAIAVGKADVAVPLGTMHEIGNTFYRLAVAPDGTSVALTPQDDIGLAEVVVPIKARALETLIISDGQQAYDLTVTTEIPPGEYKLVYGLLKSGMLMLPPDESYTSKAEEVTYEIQAGMVNTIQIGKPLWLTFYAETEGNAFELSAYSLKLYGIGGEMYDIDLNSSATASPPVITVSVDGEKVSVGTMEAIYSSYDSYSGEVPATADDDTTVITVTTSIVGFGEATGKATWGELTERTCQQFQAEEPVIYEPAAD